MERIERCKLPGFPTLWLAASSTLVQTRVPTIRMHQTGKHCRIHLHSGTCRSFRLIRGQWFFLCFYFFDHEIPTSYLIFPTDDLLGLSTEDLMHFYKMRCFRPRTYQFDNSPTLPISFPSSRPPLDDAPYPWRFQKALAKAFPETKSTKRVKTHFPGGWGRGWEWA